MSEQLQNPIYRCYGCGAEHRSLDEMEVIPGADGRDGRHHCKKCYSDWLAEVQEP